MVTGVNIGEGRVATTRDFVIVSNGSGKFTLDSSTPGIFGTMTATIAVDIPNVAVGGTFSLDQSLA